MKAFRIIESTIVPPSEIWTGCPEGVRIFYVHPDMRDFFDDMVEQMIADESELQTATDRINEVLRGNHRAG